jgi:DNA-binding transcriptional ArsR family regulator
MIRLVDWAIAQQVKPPARKFVLVVLANHTDNDGICFPGQVLLARECELSVRELQRHLAALVKAGLISRERRQRKNGSRTSDQYELKADSLPAGDDRIVPEDRRHLCHVTPMSHDASDATYLTPVSPLLNRQGNRQEKNILPASQTESRTFQLEPVSDTASSSMKTAPGIERQKRNTPFPDNFALTEDLAYYGFERGLDVSTQFENFRDHALAKDSKSRDWAASWRTWCRKAVEFGHRRYVSPPPACNLPPTDDPVERARRRFHQASREGQAKIAALLKPMVARLTEQAHAPQKPLQRVIDGIDLDFEEVWKAYPGIDGGTSRQDALNAYRAARNRGVAHKDLLEGTKHYAHFCHIKAIGMGHVMAASRFFGPAELYRNPWWTRSEIATPPKAERPQETLDGEKGTTVNAA